MDIIIAVTRTQVLDKHIPDLRKQKLSGIQSI